MERKIFLIYTLCYYRQKDDSNFIIFFYKKCLYCGNEIHAQSTVLNIPYMREGAAAGFPGQPLEAVLPCFPGLAGFSHSLFCLLGLRGGLLGICLRFLNRRTELL